MKSLRNLIAKGGILVVIALAVLSCSKGNEVKPVKPTENAKIVGKWHISKDYKYLDAATSKWISTTFKSDEYTSAEWDIGSGLTSGKYIAKFSTSNFNTNDGAWVINGDSITFTDNSTSPATAPFDGKFTVNDDGSFTIDCVRLGTRVQLTFVQA